MQIINAFKNQLFWNTDVVFDHDFATTKVLKILTGDTGIFALKNVMKFGDSKLYEKLFTNAYWLI